MFYFTSPSNWLQISVFVKPEGAFTVTQGSITLDPIVPWWSQNTVYPKIQKLQGHDRCENKVWSSKWLNCTTLLVFIHPNLETALVVLDGYSYSKQQKLQEFLPGVMLWS